MANIDDLNYKSLTELTQDEALEVIRRIRLQRRTAERVPRKQSSTSTKKPKKQKAQDMSPEDAAMLLALLTGGNS